MRDVQSFAGWMGWRGRRTGRSGGAGDELGQRGHGGLEGAGEAPPKVRAGRRRRTLTVLPLVALIFYEVSGGPFGIEESVNLAGALPAILGLLILPCVWSIPEALITAELATMFPEDSGYVAWVSAAFGPFWGFQEGFLSWVSGVADNSIYPLILAGNLEVFMPILTHVWATRAFCIVVSVMLTYLNWRGLQVVGSTTVFLTCFMLAPFVVLTIIGIPKIHASNWLDYKPGHLEKNFWDFMNVMFWNLNYWDSVSTLAGEVKDPGTSFPRALSMGVVAVVLGYLVPVLVGVGVMGQENWPDGFFPILGQEVAGDWLKAWIVLAAAASQIGLFEAEMSSDSYQVLGMAERGMLPKRLGVRSRHGTPTIGILLSSSGIAILCFTLHFQSVVDLLNYAYCLAELLEFAAFIYLRVKAPDMPRSYRIPLSTTGVCIMLFPATVLLLYLIVYPWMQLNYVVIGFCVGILLSGSILWALLECARKRGWFEFAKLEAQHNSDADSVDEEEDEHEGLLHSGTDQSEYKAVDGVDPLVRAQLFGELESTENVLLEPFL
eukprot:evm.model.scf_227.3 EVM.evm.TU.scf_227.3   scf_227:35250-42034(+)